MKKRRGVIVFDMEIDEEDPKIGGIEDAMEAASDKLINELTENDWIKVTRKQVSIKNYRGEGTGPLKIIFCNQKA